VPEVKSGSRYVRFVIAKHSPVRVLETGLPKEALEKKLCEGNEATPRTFSLVAKVLRGYESKAKDSFRQVAADYRAAVKSLHSEPGLS